MSIVEILPVACTLSSGETRDRLTSIAKLNKDALLDHRREDLVLRLTYAPEARSRVREMVRGEQTCCAFLRFDLVDSARDIRLTITAPEDARGAADELFAAFLVNAPASPASGPSCACSTAKPAKEPPGARAAGATAMTLSTSAVACGACCVLPFALPASVLAGTGSVLATLVHMQWWITVLAVLSVTGAWGWLAWQMRRTGRKPTTMTLVMMTASTVLMTASLMWPLIEKPLIRALRA
ncbi:hypothetical protein LQG66_23990 [Bradyrhizobium ontarionense]|uniref:Uncharacterized protein n=1 Tax=Bradyrhizobium ontarionense TaxID=2898149 RepID=A0ABY3R5E2_9BRAD|nr:hypothetical protein [Bradyrhizobium sp. A19]UFZ02344.1 hypothetical protein LQG66_23990 [Bradyrhizobium sp. A19]